MLRNRIILLTMLAINVMCSTLKATIIDWWLLFNIRIKPFTYGLWVHIKNTIKLIVPPFNILDMTKIENEAQYEWAMQRIEELLPLVDEKTPITDPNSIELGLLSNLAADYEDEHFPMETPTLIDMLKLRMYEMGLTQVALSKLLGIHPSRISEYLSGKKEPTLSQARIIVERLNIDPATVLGVSYAG